MGISETCIHVLDSKVMPQYETRELGIPLVIYKSVVENVCTLCGHTSHEIPFPDRLIAAAAVVRAKYALKLSGNEIRFLRKAQSISAKEMAESLGVVPETYSRWENDKAPIGPSFEKMLRLITGLKLSPMAPAVGFKPQDIFGMVVPGFRNPDEELVMDFELVRFKVTAEQPTTEAYTEGDKKAA